jgi:hypothetical protein
MTHRVCRLPSRHLGSLSRSHVGNMVHRTQAGLCIEQLGFDRGLDIAFGSVESIGTIRG